MANIADLVPSDQRYAVTGSFATLRYEPVRARPTSPSQTAVELMTGPGRNPAEGQSLLNWMEADEMNGESSDLLIRARSALLDALEALAEHRDSVIVIGAQAIYLHTGDAPVAIAEATKDSDLAFDARVLAEHPLIEEAMTRTPVRPGIEPAWPFDEPGGHSSRSNGA